MSASQALARAIEALNDWSMKSSFHPSFEARYLFGSAVNRNGVQFEVWSSDLDLVHLLSRDGSALERVDAIQDLAALAGELEMALLRALERSDAGAPIVSHCVLTPTEARYDVHKDDKQKLLTEPLFAPLPMKSDALMVRVAPPDQDPEFKARNGERLAAFAYAQKVRNQYLSVAPNGRRSLGSIPFAHNGDPLPKSLMRTAAMTAWASRAGSPIEERVDTQRGLDFLSTHVLEARASDPRVAELRDLVSARRLARGDRRPLTPEDQLLLAELLYDEASQRLETTLREQLKDYATQTLGKIQKPTGPGT